MSHLKYWYLRFIVWRNKHIWPWREIVSIKKKLEEEKSYCKSASAVIQNLREQRLYLATTLSERLPVSAKPRGWMGIASREIENGWKPKNITEYPEIYGTFKEFWEAHEKTRTTISK